MNSSDNSGPCRLTLIAVLLSLTLMCAGLGLFLLHQASAIRVQVLQAQSVVAGHDKNFEPTAKRFIANLQAFSKNNSDLLPILTKYNLQPGAPAPKK